MTPRRGDVCWVSFAEPVGRRPVLVIQNDVGNANAASTIVAHISSRPRRDYPFLVAVDSSALGKPSWIHCETINTIPCEVLGERLATLPPETMRKVDEALRCSLDLM